MKLRGAVHRADADVLEGVLTGPDWPADGLQMLGDAVLVVAREFGHNIERAARRCVLDGTAGP